eukprot:CAMPEP_0174838876 /NCGR_PEP_ID=MMETSP1114-20130205/7687_1 /TAXON_ID=312471 /ORGANISM="Neobodo designis, Strain CCAP 1951/1" /LENGTH=56 /DNA_ID=CAMNT_0016072989 /DNA_START=12 /DNA_END=179 /DNA_ORIENTATION=-
MADRLLLDSGKTRVRLRWVLKFERLRVHRVYVNEPKRPHRPPLPRPEQRQRPRRRR